LVAPPATARTSAPGLVTIGFGLGFSFVATPPIVMSRVASEDAGMVSGLMQTAHEIGIALGVAMLSAVATAATVASGLAAGYRQGMLATAVVAGVLAVLALVAVPAVRGSAPPRVAPAARTD
jgi:predicted MFS family arabinose efflux permease